MAGGTYYVLTKTFNCKLDERTGQITQDYHITKEEKDTCSVNYFALGEKDE